MKNTFLSAFFTLILLAIAVGCQRPTEGDGKSVFKYNEPAGIATLDPAFAKDQARIWAVSQIFNSLIRFDENLEIEPCIAKSWTISSDGLTYTFILRDDIYFHKDPLFGTGDSTRRVTAEDFKYSLNRILDPKVASPGVWILSPIYYVG